jgi:hypothetical protein
MDADSRFQTLKLVESIPEVERRSLASSLGDADPQGTPFRP